MKKILLILLVAVVIVAAAYYLYPRSQAPTGITTNNTTSAGEVPSSTTSNPVVATSATATSQPSIDAWYQQYIGTSTALSVVSVYQTAPNPSLPSPSNSYTFTYQGTDYSVSVYKICGPAGCTGSIVSIGNKKIYQTSISLDGVGGIISNQNNIYLILNDDQQNIALILNSDLSVSSVVTATYGKGINPPDSVPSSVEQILEKSNG